MIEADCILGIETTCDDTSVALVQQSGEVIACETLSQDEIHSEYGGIFPELASRAHLQSVLPIVQRVIGTIDGDRSRIKAIGVSRGPGLIGSLLVGINTATGLAAAWDKHVIGVNHLRGHLRSPELDGQKVVYPAIVLLASGGHTVMCYLKSSCEISILGQTRDDSIGECYDKVARMLGLGMPGGPAIDRLEKLGTSIYDLPRPMLATGYEFSFSGLKSSVARLLEKEKDATAENVAASFVASCLDVLRVKLKRAMHQYEPASVVIVGGVAASVQIREMVQKICTQHGVIPYLPPLQWSTDNAAMIALAAWDYVALDIETALDAAPNLPITDW